MFSTAQIIKKLKETNRFWLVFTGDSWTSAEWVHPNWREIVEYVLKMELTEGEDWKTPSWGIRSFNFAYDGAATGDILTKIGEINLVKPDLVISLMGGNDPALKIPVSETVKNIEEISQKISAPLIWCPGISSADPAKNKRDWPYVEAILGLPQSQSFKILDLFEISKKFPLERIFTFKTSADNPLEELKKGDPDLQHPNALGNAYIAQVILKEVFGIEFDPEKYLQDILSGLMYPGYES